MSYSFNVHQPYCYPKKIVYSDYICTSMVLSASSDVILCLTYLPHLITSVGVRHNNFVIILAFALILCSVIQRSDTCCESWISAWDIIWDILNVLMDSLKLLLYVFIAIVLSSSLQLLSLKWIAEELLLVNSDPWSCYTWNCSIWYC